MVCGVPLDRVRDFPHPIGPYLGGKVIDNDVFCSKCAAYLDRIAKALETP